MDSTITIRIDENDKNILTEMAKELDVPFSQLVREAIKEYIKEKNEDDNFVIQHF